MIDFYNLYAEKKLAVPAGWMWYKAEVIDGANGAKFTKLTGAVCTIIFKAGPRKGLVNWSKRDKSTESEFIVAQVDFKAFIAEWASLQHAKDYQLTASSHKF